MRSLLFNYSVTYTYITLYHDVTCFSGQGSNMGATLIGGAAAATATAYGVHHLTHGHHPHGHHLGHYGMFKHHHHHGHYGKFKHGKFGKRIRLGGKHGLLGWKHHHHGFFGGKYKRWK